MKNFIEVYSEYDYPILMNTGHIVAIRSSESKNSTEIKLGEDYIFVKESYDEIKTKIENAQTVYDIDKLMDLLPPREKQIVKMKFGICGFPVYSDEIIGKEFDITRERIRQVTDKGLKRIAKYVLTRNIQEEAI